MATSVETLRQQWEEGNRRFESQAADPVYPQLLEQLEVATDELRKRVGETFTLAQLADAYGASDHWLREAVEERIAAAGWVRHLSVVQDAAFHQYARGATDYSP
jgi:DNA-binding GntR family transcriptional regulator